MQTELRARAFSEQSFCEFCTVCPSYCISEEPQAQKECKPSQEVRDFFVTYVQPSRKIRFSSLAKNNHI